MRHLRCALVVACSLVWLTVAGRAAAEPLALRDVPEPLRPWIGWVLHGQEGELCPTLTGDASRRACVWPARVSIEADADEGRFTQEWQVYTEGYVALPGDEAIWPLDVRADDAPAAVVLQGGVPAVRLAPGRHKLTGRFAWDAPPALLRVPPEVGLIALRLRGADVPFPKRDDDGRLWLERRAGGAGEEDRAELRAVRLVVDEVPLQLETRLELQVSGRSRELALPNVVLPGFAPMWLESSLPARVERDGSVIVQARPGRFAIALRARLENRDDAITLPALAEPAGATPSQDAGRALVDPHEAWAVEARPELRLATVEGVPAIDPEQTALPAEWRAYPAFLVEPGATLRLEEKRRGDSDPAPDRLTLRRTFWLDFDGGGYTVQDQIVGMLSRSWRLEVGPEMALGRVAVDGRDQLITKLAGSEIAGVEVRQARPRIEADSRIEGLRGRVPALGWQHDFEDVSAELRLPPGWRLLHAFGVDDVAPTWIASWSLLDLFLVLVTALAVGRLWGLAMGGIALAALALTWTEPEAPRWVWPAVLAVEALVRALPTGRARDVARGARLVALVTLVLFAVPFMLRQVRQAMYPALVPPIERYDLAQREALDATSGTFAEARMQAPESPASEAPDAGRAAEEEGLVAPSESKVRRYIDKNRLSGEPSIAAYAATRADRYAPDPSAQVTTGPGLPAWRWERALLRWRGPVQAGQELSLWLVGPRGNFVLAWLRVGLVALLALCCLRGVARGRLAGPFGEAGGASPASPASRPGGGSATGGTGTAGAVLGALLAIGLGVWTPGSVARADLPPDALLDQLRQRLLEPPACAPACAAIPRLRVEAGSTWLRVRVEIDVVAESGVPLPGSVAGWTADRVLLDGAPASGLLRDPNGPLWIVLPPGRHQVVMEGPLPDRESVDVPLPLRPHRVEAPAAGLDGWRVEGVHEDGTAAENLSLVRTRRVDDAAPEGSPATLPPFVRVERRLDLGLEWQATTRIVRLTPPGVAVVLAVPLLAGESVTTEGVRVEGGKVTVSLGPQMLETAWTSSVSQGGALALRAAEGVPWVESWAVDASPIWHVEATGIPMIHASDAGAGPRVREWRPWPGEEVALAVTRPAGAPGRTLTVDGASLAFTPGLRAADATLELTLRSSRGGQHVVTLPEGAVLQDVKIGGASQPIRLEGRSVTLPIVPGAQMAAIAWQQPGGVTSRVRTPEIDVGAPLVNASLRVAMSADRWVLFAGGPRMGPVVLFWSFLVVVAFVAAGLGRVRTTPLRAREWFLLGVGMTQIPVALSAVVAGWLLALGLRRERGATLPDARFRIAQIGLALWTVAALAALFLAIRQGLLGPPEMQVSGNGSTAQELLWYQDRSGAELPTAWVLSVPLMVYRVAMLAWALWLAFALLRWLRWGWAAYAEGGLWRPWRRTAKP